MKKDWDLLVGETHGTLTVKQVVGTDRNGYTYLLCQCICGSEKVVKGTDFSRWKVKTCGKLECKRKARGGVPLPEAQESFPPYAGERASAIEQRLKPKYFCKAVAQECTISTLLHICCCECDRPCKRCDNTPQKCGAMERKKCNS